MGSLFHVAAAAMGQRPIYPLTQITGAQPLVAVSGHRLRPDYTGPGIRLIRTDTLAELDIPYRRRGALDTLDPDVVQDFLGSAMGRMIGFYNQGTGGNFVKLDDLRRPNVSAQVDAQGIPYLSFHGPMVMASGAQTRRQFHTFSVGDLYSYPTPGFFYTMGATDEVGSMGANAATNGIRLMPLAHTTSFMGKNQIALYEARSDASGVLLGCDDEFQSFAAVADATANGGQIGSYLLANSYYSQLNLGTVIAMGRTLADASPERAGLRAALNRLYGIRPVTANRLWIIGDSIPAGTGSDGHFVSYARVAQRTLPQLPVYNMSRGGDKLSEQNPLWATKHAPEIALYPSANRIVAVSCTGNDIISGRSAANCIADLQTIAANIEAAGARIMFTTMMPAGGTPAGMVTIGETVNTWMRENSSINQRGLCDFQAHPIMGVAGTQTLNPAYWADSRHPNAAGHGLLGPVFAAAVQSMMV